MSFLKRFQKMVAELRGHEGLVIKELKIGRPATEKKLSCAKPVLWPLPDAMRAFYEEANGVRLRWQAKDETVAEEVAGSIDLLPVERVFGDWEDVIWFADMPRFKDIRPIDFFETEACAALKIGKTGLDVVFHNCGESSDSMHMDFATYLDRLLEARGFRYWQTAALGKRVSSWETARTFRTWMPKLGFAAPHLIDARATRTDARRTQKETASEAKMRKLFEKHGVSFVSKGKKAGYVYFALAWTRPNLTKGNKALVEMFGAAYGCLNLKSDSNAVGDIVFERL